MNELIDLLSLTEAGGCSSKLPAARLREIVAGIPSLQSDRLLVGNDTSDDALVYAIGDENAIIQTTDFFPPVCSAPYDFGQIAAANALSDIFAMGGLPITALNIVMFPSAAMDIDILKQILNGGAEKVREAGAVLAGGHTIDGDVPVYGLSVTGMVHPDRIITNNAAKTGDVLILTKGIGTGVITAGKRIGEAADRIYNGALSSMKLLNTDAVAPMQDVGVKCATDITGFGLAGHALEIARASGVTLILESERIPLLDGVLDLLDMGCIPGAAFRNLSYAEPEMLIGDTVAYSRRMAVFDAQTSGGLLICAPENHAGELLTRLIDAGYVTADIIGRVTEREDTYLRVY